MSPVPAISYLPDGGQPTTCKTPTSGGEQARGWQADRVAREHIGARGYGDWFTHRLGHSIGFEVHSEAVNLDGFETHDTRRIILGVCFSVEPGIYLPEFGVRSEIDVFMSEERPGSQLAGAARDRADGVGTARRRATPFACRFLRSHNIQECLRQVPSPSGRGLG